MGSVIAGLSPEQLRAIALEAMRGLSVQAAAGISPSNFMAFKTDQIRRFELLIVFMILYFCC